jgi:hypothetical protein
MVMGKIYQTITGLEESPVGFYTYATSKSEKGKRIA